MSLADLPLNDQIVEFGFGWHGRHVVPLTGAPYIELPGGRQITAAGIGNGAHPSTFLVDNGMPAVTTVLDDPEAALWNVAITNGSGTDNYFRHWTRTDPAIRQVRVGDDFRVVNPSISNFGSYALVRAGLQTGIADQQVPLSALGNVPSDFNSSQVVDISPDGLRWIFALSRISNQTSPYQIAIEDVTYSGPLALIELEFNAGLTAMTYRVLATYEQCSGIVISSQNGADLEQRVHVLRIGSTGIVGESDYAWTPSWTLEGSGEPESCNTSSADPCSDAFRYSTGTSVGTSRVETVTGAWYDAAGVAQLVTLRFDAETTLAKGSPAAGPGGRYYWDTYTITRKVIGYASYAGGAVEEYFNLLWTDQQTATARIFNMTLGGAPVFSFSGSHAVPTTHQTGTQVRQDAPSVNRVFAAGFASTFNVTVNLAHEFSNKVRGAIVRAEKPDFCEYTASACITPAGVDAGYHTTGNLYPGDRNDRANFDLSLWRYHTNFQAGSYNPVTGQVVRSLVGGERYTWV